MDDWTANKIISDALRYVDRRERPPLAWAVERDGELDIVAAAWLAATDATAMRVLLSEMRHPAMGDGDDYPLEVICPDWPSMKCSHYCERCRKLLRRAVPTLTLDEVVAAIVSRPCE